MGKQIVSGDLEVTGSIIGGGTKLYRHVLGVNPYNHPSGNTWHDLITIYTTSSTPYDSFDSAISDAIKTGFIGYYFAYSGQGDDRIDNRAPSNLSVGIEYSGFSNVRQHVIKVSYAGSHRATLYEVQTTATTTHNAQDDTYQTLISHTETTVSTANMTDTVTPL